MSLFWFESLFLFYFRSTFSTPSTAVISSKKCLILRRRPFFLFGWTSPVSRLWRYLMSKRRPLISYLFIFGHSHYIGRKKGQIFGRRPLFWWLCAVTLRGLAVAHGTKRLPTPVCIFGFMSLTFLTIAPTTISSIPLAVGFKLQA